MKKKVKQDKYITLENLEKELGEKLQGTSKQKSNKKLWAISDIMPQEIKLNQRFSDLEYCTIKKFSTPDLVKKLGEAVLLFLCGNNYIRDTDLSSGPIIDLSLLHKALYELAIQTVYDYEKSRRKPAGSKRSTLSYRTKADGTIFRTRIMKKEGRKKRVSSIDIKKAIPKKIKKYRGKR